MTHLQNTNMDQWIKSVPSSHFQERNTELVITCSYLIQWSYNLREPIWYDITGTVKGVPFIGFPLKTLFQNPFWKFSLIKPGSSFRKND